MSAPPETPGTMGTVRRPDRVVALQLYQRGIPVSVIENTFVLAATRRLIRPAEDFATQLVSNGSITGAVEYFGHGAALPFRDGSFSSILAQGEQAGADTNVTPFNVTLLSNAQLDTHAIVILHSCLAGYGGKRYSIAQSIANQLQRIVMAATAGTFFSTNPNTRFAVNGLVLPNQKPIYSIQDGGVPLIRFLPSLSH